MSFHKTCFEQRPRKKSIMENEIDDIVAVKTYVDPQDENNEISGGNIQTWRIERFLIGRMLKNNIKAMGDLTDNSWHLQTKKDFDVWGIRRLNLDVLEKDGYITIEKLKGKYNVRVRPTSKPFPKLLDNLTHDERYGRFH